MESIIYAGGTINSQKIEEFLAGSIFKQAYLEDNITYKKTE